MNDNELDDYEIKRNGEELILTLHSDLTSEYVNDLKENIKAAIADGAKDICFDMINIRLIDSTGIGLLVSIQNTVKKIDGGLTVINLASNIFDLFLYMKLDQLFTVKGE